MSTKVNSIRVAFSDGEVYHITFCCEELNVQLRSLKTIRCGRKQVRISNDDNTQVKFCPFCGKKIELFNEQSL